MCGLCGLGSLGNTPRSQRHDKLTRIMPMKDDGRQEKPQEQDTGLISRKGEREGGGLGGESLRPR